MNFSIRGAAQIALISITAALCSPTFAAGPQVLISGYRNDEVKKAPYLYTYRELADELVFKSKVAFPGFPQVDVNALGVDYFDKNYAFAVITLENKLYRLNVQSREISVVIENDPRIAGPHGVRCDSSGKSVYIAVRPQKTAEGTCMAIRAQLDGGVSGPVKLAPGYVVAPQDGTKEYFDAFDAIPFTLGDNKKLFISAREEDQGKRRPVVGYAEVSGGLQDTAKVIKWFSVPGAVGAGATGMDIDVQSNRIFVAAGNEVYSSKLELPLEFTGWKKPTSRTPENIHGLRVNNGYIYATSVQHKICRRISVGPTGEPTATQWTDVLDDDQFVTPYLAFPPSR